MARTAESGSWCTDWKRDTTASSEGFRDTASSWENSGNPSDRFIRAFAFSLLPRYTKATPETRGADWNGPSLRRDPTSPAHFRRRSPGHAAFTALVVLHTHQPIDVIYI